MYEGNKAWLSMEKILLTGGSIDQTVLKCIIIACDDAEEQFIMELEGEELLNVSLDAIYKCTIETEGRCIYCDGMVKERYRSEKGNLLVYQIENGFYQENNL